MASDITETFALVGLILGGVSILAVVVLSVLLLSMRSNINKLSKKVSTSLNDDGKLKNDSFPSQLTQDVQQLKTKVKDLDGETKRSVEELKDIKQQLQKLLERVSKCEGESSARSGNDVARTPGAQPLQRFVEKPNLYEKATKPASGPSPVSPESSSNDSDAPTSNGDARKVVKAGSTGIHATRNGVASDQDDVTVKADIGFGQSSSGYQPAELEHQHQTLMSPEVTSSTDQRVVPLLPVQRVAPPADQATTLAPLPATPTLGNRGVDNVKTSPGMSVSSSPGNISSRNKRPNFGAYANHGTPLSARGINPEKHPELHAKELAEMSRLVQLHCHDSATVVSRTTVKCQWCHETFTCPPYRPQSFFFKDIHNNGEHDGHFWSCTANPNNSLQAGRGVNVGDGKVLI